MLRWCQVHFQFALCDTTLETPRKSLRKSVIEELEELFLQQQVKKLLHHLLDDGIDDEDTVEQCVGMAIEGAYECTLNRRYIER